MIPVLSSFSVNGYRYFRVQAKEYEAIISEVGASLVSFRFEGKEMLSTMSLEDFPKDKSFHGAIIGPLPGRRDSDISLFGKRFEIDRNEGKASCHGGKYNVSHQKFALREEKDPLGLVLRFETRISFLRDLPLSVIYCFEKEPAFAVGIECDSLPKGPFSFAFHPYWNLGEKDVSSLRLFVRASLVATYSPSNVPLSYQDADAPFDFRNGKIISENMPKKGYDHCYLLEGDPIVLESQKTRLIMHCAFPAIQLYSDNGPDPLPMPDGSNRKKQGSIAVEPVMDLVEMAASSESNSHADFHRYVRYEFMRIA